MLVQSLNGNQILTTSKKNLKQNKIDIQNDYHPSIMTLLTPDTYDESRKYQFYSHP